ncbi:unnamed protein product [Rotaria sp. Silwood1]|nr:unnamed protein product [Rotaria sp. Silwood1]
MASILRAVSGSSSSSVNTSSPTNDIGKRLTKWALVIGVPTAVCVAAYLVYRQQQGQAKKSAIRRSSLSTPSTTLTATTTTSSTTKAGGDAVLTSKTRTKDRLILAIELKNEGNIKYREKKFNEAIEAYTQAINTCPVESTEELSQFYQNRAAAWESLKIYDKVIEDCSRAIELNPKYIKCIQRRARAAETVNNFELALEDYSTLCFLDSYQPSYIMAADKVLTNLARQYVEKLPTSTAELSNDSVRTSLNEFEDDPVLSSIFINEVRTTQPDSPLARAYQAYDECRFTDIPSLCTQELELSILSPYKLHALLLRGSFYLLMGNYIEALADFNSVINDLNATEMMKIIGKLKRANTKIHQRDLEGAMLYHMKQADAPVSVQLYEYMIAEDIVNFSYDELGNTRGTPRFTALKPIKLRWSIPEACNDMIEKSLAQAKSVYENVDLHVYIHNTYGKSFMKKCKLSPDAYIQMALQLAHYRDSGRFNLTYEASMTRLFRDGRTETVRSCSIESSEWVKSMEDPTVTKDERIKLLRRACDYHQQQYRDAMTGKGIDRHLFCLYVLSKYLEIESPFLQQVLHEPWKLSTSQTPVNYDDKHLKKLMTKNPDTAARHGVVNSHSLVPLGGGFGPVAADGYGVSYIIATEDLIYFHVSSNRSSPETDSKRFGQRIRQAMEDMRALFDEESHNIDGLNEYKKI